MEDLLQPILASMSSVKKPQMKALMMILMAYAYFQGRANFRNLSRFCGFSEDTLRRWSKRRFRYQELNAKMIIKVTGDDSKVDRIVALDASFLKKSGKRTQGLGYFHNGGSGRIEKGLEISLLSIIDLNRHTGFSLLARQTRPEKQPGNRIDQALAQVKECVPELELLGVRTLVADAWYSKYRFVEGVLQQGLHMVGKLRDDAQLFFDPPAREGRGRPPIYGARLLTSDLRRLKKIELAGKRFHLHTGILISKSLKRHVRIVVLREIDTKKVRAILYSTDLDASAEKIWSCYSARFQIEFVIRDAKQHAGLNHCQARSTVAIENHLNQSFSAINILKLEDLKGTRTVGRKVISIASWRRKKMNEHFARVIFEKLGVSLNSQKIRQTFEFVRRYGCIAA